MTVEKTRHQSVARRVTLMAVALVVVVLVCMGAGIYYLTERSTRTEIIQSIGNTVQSVAQSIDAADGANQELARAAMRGFQRYFEERMHLDAATGELRSYGALVNGDFSSVDRFASETQGVAAVLARKGDQFIRVTHSSKDAKGNRLLTPLQPGEPGYEAVRKGEAYVGRVQIDGLSYMGHYLPVLNHDTQLVGALFVGTNLGVFDSMLEQQVQQTRFFETGGTYVIQPGARLEDATFVVHPGARGRRVLEAYPQARPLLEALAQHPQDAVPDAAPLLVNTGGRIFTLMRPAANGWWIVAEVPYAEAMASHEQGMWAMWGIVAVAVAILGIGLLLVLRLGVAEPLRGLTRAITLVAQGNLTQPFRTRRKDEIGALVQEVEGMRQRYLQMLHQVRQAVDSVTTASQEIAQGNQDLSGRTEATASHLAQTAQSMELLSQTVRQSADAAQQANALAGTAAEVAARGGQVVGEVVRTMEDIHQSARRIADIIGVIDGIAFQTNILALNAAVEAARAGEQGRGFAVVAGEVRALAGRSASAAREIRQLIGDSVQRVDAGTRLVGDAGTTMSEIVGSVRQVGDIISEISAASSEQSQSITQVTQAVGQLDQMTHQNASLVEESAAAAHSLRAQAGQLVQALSVFELGEPQSAAEPSGAPPIVTLAQPPAPAGHSQERPARVAQAAPRQPALLDSP